MKQNAINKEQYVKEQFVPTVLVSADDEELGFDLVDRLQLEGFHVLKAQNRTDAFHIATVHSRPIHLLLMDLSMEGSPLTALLRQYRDEMRVLFITKADEIDKLLAEVRELLKPNGGVGSGDGFRDG